MILTFAQLIRLKHSDDQSESRGYQTSSKDPRDSSKDEERVSIR
jgi:hypothetical protein